MTCYVIPMGITPDAGDHFEASSIVLFEVASVHGNQGMLGMHAWSCVITTDAEYGVRHRYCTTDVNYSFRSKFGMVEIKDYNGKKR